MDRPTVSDALSEEELDRLLAQPSDYPSGKRNLALLLVLADAGLRVSEATALETRDLLTDGGQLTHVLIRRGKGGKPGQVKLTPRSAVKLGAWLEAREKLAVGNGAVFCTVSKGKASGHYALEGQRLEPGKPVSTNYVRGLVRRLAEKAGIDKHVTPHVLRHTFATRLLRGGENIAAVQKLMRHRRVQTTVDIYGHLDQKDADAAIGRLPGSEEADQTSRIERLVAEARPDLSPEKRRALADLLAEVKA